ncbi:unnamed protein product [Umbelopsis ramanniana]
MIHFQGLQGLSFIVPIEHRSHHPLFPVLKTTPRMPAEKGRDTYMPTKQDPSRHLTSAKSRYLDLTINDFQNTAASTHEGNASECSQGITEVEPKIMVPNETQDIVIMIQECYTADA